MEVVDDERWRSTCRIREERDERAVGQGDESKTVQVDERVVGPRKRGGGSDDALIDELTRSDAGKARSGARDATPDERDEAVRHLPEQKCASTLTARCARNVVGGDCGEDAGR